MHVVTVLEFATVTFVAVITPGPDVMLAFTNGSRYGVRKACAGMIGVLLSDLFLIVAVALGLGGLLTASELWFSFLRYIGAGYLGYLGITMIRNAGRPRPVMLEQKFSQTAVPVAIWLRSFWVAVTNPKAYLFFSALLPLFIDPNAPLPRQYSVLTVVFIVTEVAIMLAYVIVGAKTIRYFNSRWIAWLERGCGGALFAMAASLALFRRASTQH